MKSKEIFLTALDTFIAVTTETESHHKIIQLGQSYRERIQVFRVLVPIVGSFNVGKSSLINAYLNLEVGKGLPTDIIPKTALATEILPTSEGEDEVIQIFDRKGHLISEMDLVGFAKYGLNDITETHKQASYARAKLNSETLVANPRTTLVDMPGLDSGIRSHNEAIQRYLPLGSYFILVIDIERGAFRESEIIQLGEFLSQEIECTVILNKLDRKRTDGESVTKYIKDQITSEFGKELPIFAVSARKKEIEAFSKTINAIDPENAFRNFWRQHLLDLFDQANLSLNTQYSAINFSSAEADKNIKQLINKQKELENKLLQDEREIKARYSEAAANNIVRKLRGEIRSNSHALANLYLENGQEVFRNQLNEIVRTRLNASLSSAIKNTREEINHRYQANIQGLDTQMREIVESEKIIPYKAGEEFFQAIRTVAEKSSIEFNTAAKAMQEGKIKDAYTTIATGLAFGAKLISPWLGVVFDIVPIILGEFNKERYKVLEIQKLQIYIENELADKVAKELQMLISEDYTKLTESELSRLKEGMEFQIGRIKDNINKGQTVREAGKREADKRREELIIAVEKLTEAKRMITDA